MRYSPWRLVEACAAAVACLAVMVASALVLQPSIALGQTPTIGYYCSTAYGLTGCFTCSAVSSSSPGGTGCDNPTPTLSIGMCVAASYWTHYYYCLADTWDCGIQRNCATNAYAGQCSHLAECSGN